MSTVAEIESAIEKLQGSEISELAAWFNEYQQMVLASAQVFAMHDREEPVSGAELAKRLREAEALLSPAERREFGDDIETGRQLMRREHLH